ncbi:hypothetical protein JNB63_02185 [Microbacterium trichothecenolyticum]|uniref:hypothetical protein n=1 Tax=Microbacterium trichothecenolyticum TaxID=69370 RepID=UPI001C6E497E|nr:hypothetical protein [Microbacterium trichothecenolyticum]MBW9118895.1 hypothetical protein [Microbacterium trichothecenolyticum]
MSAEGATPPRPRTPPIWWVVFSVGLLVALAGAIVWLGATNAPSGDRPLIENPGGIIALLIGGVTSTAALIIPKLNTIRDATAATQHHVVNDHGDRVLRDDLDELLRIARSTEARVGAVENVQKTLVSDIGGLREENRNDRRADADRFSLLEGRVRDIEHTKEKP